MSRFNRFQGAAHAAKKKRCVIGVITSGRDSQGMNATVRAVVRTSLYLGCRVFFIKEGYFGLVNGGDCIVEASWFSVSNIISLGGTVIGSAPCEAFRGRDGRLKAVHNLVQYGIHNLIVIGGVGSLTGANILKEEWLSLLNELVSKGKITKSLKLKYCYLKVTGIVGSVDNDFCGTDMTIGASSALHRITEQIDSIVTTASSHQRTFIFQIIGSRCGFLALVAAISSEADYVFIPETVPPKDWEVQLPKKLSQEREIGKRLNIIILAEGSVDASAKPITAQRVKDCVGKEAIITVLEHVQRGGNASAFDRVLGTRIGTFAVLNLINSNPDSEASIIALDGNDVVSVPLTQCVQKSQLVHKALDGKKYEESIRLRGPRFQDFLNSFEVFTKVKPPKPPNETAPKFRIGIIHIGTPCCGMNSAVHAFVRIFLHNDCAILGIYRGIDGLIAGDVKPITWSEVSGIMGKGGAFLGTRKRTAAQHFSEISERIQEFKIDAILFVGGFEAFQTVLQLAENRTRYPEFNIPLCVIPATISNNMPGTDMCIGADTALNEITTACDKILQSAQGTTQRVFVVETMGGYCGYLATLGGIASGADAAYIFEEDITLSEIIEDIKTIRRKIKEGHHIGLIVKSSKANNSYTTDRVFTIFEEEGKDLYTTKLNILGHIQQGGRPTPYDRVMGSKMATKAADWILEMLDNDGENKSKISPETAVVLGIHKKRYQFSAVQALKVETSFEYRLPLMEWWLHLTPLLRTLSTPASFALPGNAVEFLNTMSGQFIEDE